MKKNIFTALAITLIVAGFLLVFSESDDSLAVVILSKIAGLGAMYAGYKALLTVKPELNNDNETI